MENELYARNLYREYPVENVFSLSSLFTFFKRRYTRDYVFKGEIHDFWEVVCVTDGKVGITADKNVYVLSAGQMIVHPPEEFHAIWSDCGTSPEAIIFSFRAHCFPALERRIFDLSPDEVAALRSILHDAKETLSFDGYEVVAIKEGMHMRASVVFKRLEIFLLGVFSAKHAARPEYTGRSAENYMRILSAMEENICLNVGLKELASVCNMSVPALEKTVYRYLGCGAMNYFNALKMQRAKELLASGSSVKEVSIHLGFSNQNYFSSRFKKYAGVSPSCWKKD